MEAPADDAEAEALLPRSSRMRDRELGMMMGRSGLLLSDVENALEQPGARALLIAAGAGLFSLYFFRAAWVMDEEERTKAHDS